jgi:hypothetical protein
MSTVAQIVTKALRRLGVYGTGEDPSAEDIADATDALDVMLSSWAAYGVNVDANIPLPIKHEPAIIAMLAVRLSDDYGVTAGPVVQRDAADGWQMLQAEYITAPAATFDNGLVYTLGRVVATE